MPMTTMMLLMVMKMATMMDGDADDGDEHNDVNGHDDVRNSDGDKGDDDDDDHSTIVKDDGFPP